jgi:SAP domain
MLEDLNIDKLKIIAAQNGISSKGDKKEIIKRLNKFLKLHGKFVKDIN